MKGSDNIVLGIVKIDEQMDVRGYFSISSTARYLAPLLGDEAIIRITHLIPPIHQNNAPAPTRSRITKAEKKKSHPSDEEVPDKFGLVVPVGSATSISSTGLTSVTATMLLVSTGALMTGVADADSFSDVATAAEVSI